MLKKIKNSLKKISFNLKKSDIVIFHEIQSNLLISHLDDYEAEVFHTADVIYFNFKIALLVLYYLKFVNLKHPKLNLRFIYYMACIHYMNPLVMITWIDNCQYFFELCKNQPNVKYIAIQNGARACYDVKERTINYYNLDHYFCFGHYEKDFFTMYGASIKNYHPVGSLKLQKYIETEKVFPSMKYDICVVSQWSENMLFDPQCAPFVKFDTMLGEVLKNMNLKCGIACRTNSVEEKEYFIQHYGDVFDLLVRQDEFSSYRAVASSKIIVSHGSTLSLEAIHWQKKILMVDFTSKMEYSYLSFVEKNFGKWGELITLSNQNKNMMTDKIKTLLNMDEAKYRKIISPYVDYFMQCNVEASFSDKLCALLPSKAENYKYKESRYV